MKNDNNNVLNNDELFELIWPGKKDAISLANTPSSKNLILDTLDSFSKDGKKGSADSENMYIEGDNLDVLKLLKKDFLGKIKIIYIDPPYNTRKDTFAYNDDYSKSKKESKQETKDDNYINKNLKNSQRLHTDWLNMMYPRLILARELLSDDGVIFISIDDNEHANLKIICDEIFGEDNFISNFKWNRVKKAPSLSNSIRTKYEYILAYYKKNHFKLFGKASYNKQAPLWHLPNKKQMLTFPKKSIRVKNDFLKGYYGGSYQVELFDDLIYENGLNKNEVKIEACSAWGQEKILKYINEGKTFEIKKDLKTLYYDMDNKNNFIAPSDIINNEECSVKSNLEASKELNDLGIPFEYSKPTNLIEYLLNMVRVNDSSNIVLDFFSGSATTAHAVMKLNSEDNGRRKFIMVELPQCCNQKSKAFSEGYKNICEIGKERIRRAGEKIKEKMPILTHSLDIGFRVFKVDENCKN